MFLIVSFISSDLVWSLCITVLFFFFFFIVYFQEKVHNSICHTATIISNSFMHCGTTSDTFLRYEWTCFCWMQWKFDSVPLYVKQKKKEWGTCTSSCGCAKNRKTGCERLPGWHRVSWVAWGPSNTVIFEREAVRALQKNVPVFEVLAIETLPRDSAFLEDCSHVDSLQVLVTALRSKRASAWTLFTSWFCTCCGEKSMWRARRQNLLRGSCDPASSYTSTSAIQFPIGLPSLQSARSSRFWGWWWRHSRRAVLHLAEGTPDDGAADTTLDRVHGCQSFWREPKKKLRRLLVERRLQR